MNSRPATYIALFGAKDIRVDSYLNSLVMQQTNRPAHREIKREISEKVWAVLAKDIREKTN